MDHGTCCAGGKKKPWYLSGLFLITGLTLVLMGASFIFPAMEVSDGLSGSIFG